MAFNTVIRSHLIHFKKKFQLSNFVQYNNWTKFYYKQDKNDMGTENK